MISHNALENLLQEYPLLRQMAEMKWQVPMVGGDAFNVIVEAIKAKGADSAAIADYLHNGLKDFSGLTGEIAFNEKGDRVGNLYYLYQVDKNGEFVMQRD